MGFREELENELKDLQLTRNIMLGNRVFTMEEINEINFIIKRIETILSVLKD